MRRRRGEGATVPTDDELLRLLDAFAEVSGSVGYLENESTRLGAEEEARAHQAVLRQALLAHIEREYVRRAAHNAARGVVPWQPGDELPEVAIRRLRDNADG